MGVLWFGMLSEILRVCVFVTCAWQLCMFFFVKLKKLQKKKERRKKEEKEKRKRKEKEKKEKKKRNINKSFFFPPFSALYYEGIN